VNTRYLWRDADSGEIFGRSDSEEFAKKMGRRYAAEAVVGHCRNMEVIADGNVIASFERTSI
jgi:hypothetical protein